MALGEKLFEKSGSVTGFKVTKVHPIKGVTMEVSFVSEIKSIGKFPSGKNVRITSFLLERFRREGQTDKFESVLCCTSAKS